MSILEQNEAGVSVQNIWREHSINSATFYNWGSKFCGMDMPIMKRRTELKAENSRLKNMYTEKSWKSKIRHEELEGKCSSHQIKR